MSQNETSALIIRNIATLEEAGSIADNIDKTMLDTINASINDWVKQREWKGDLAHDDYEESWFAPASWQPPSSDSEAWYAYYLWSFEDSEHDKWYLSSLLGAAKGRTGFKFNADHGTFGVTRSTWKKFASSQLHKFPEIGKAGFEYNNGSWFKPWRLDITQVADAYANDVVVDALGPMRDALQSIADVHDCFDRLVKLAIKELQK